MSKADKNAELARLWIDSWTRMDMDWLRQHLAPDFVHVSPFGRLEGRDHYLATVEPMARKSVVSLNILNVVADETQAAIWFENETPNGAVPSCDWLRIDGEQIQEIRSFYDTHEIREVLSSEEQDALGDG